MFIVEWYHPESKKWVDVLDTMKKVMVYETKEEAEKKIETLNIVTNFEFEFRIKEGVI